MSYYDVKASHPNVKVSPCSMRMSKSMEGVANACACIADEDLALHCYVYPGREAGQGLTMEPGNLDRGALGFSLPAGIHAKKSQSVVRVIPGRVRRKTRRI